MTDPNRLRSSMGRRPIESEMRPHIGLKINCISEKTENRIPIVAPMAIGERARAVR